MTVSEAVYEHDSEECGCIISPGCLREIRRRRMLSIEAITDGSVFSREHLAGVERGEVGKCVEPNVIRAYEKAMGATMEAEVFTLMDDHLRSLVLAHEMLARLYWARDLKQL